jgi:hypothetical protein
MDDQKHVTATSDGPENTNATHAGGWSLTARLGSLLLALSFTKHGATAAAPTPRVRSTTRAPKPSELHPIQPDELWSGDAVLWHREDGSLAPATVESTCQIAGKGSHGQRVKIVREDYVWSSELELDPVRGMSHWRSEAIGARLDARHGMSASARRSARG